MATKAVWHSRCTKPEFDFVDEKQFKARLWSKKLLDAIISASGENKIDPMKMFALALHKLAQRKASQLNTVKVSYKEIQAEWEFIPL